MNTATRFRNTLAFENCDRLPKLEWAPWWTLTLDRWHEEGLPAELVRVDEVQAYFDLDQVLQFLPRARQTGCPAPPYHGAGIITDGEDYAALIPFLFPPTSEAFDWPWIERCAARQQQGELIIWLTFEGFFWFPRTLFGIERHLYAFYEQPQLMHEMNERLLEFNLAALEAFCQVCTPDFLTFAEDMSFRSGPMIGKPLFDEFVGPYYRRLIPAIRQQGIQPLVDSDGEVSALVPWFEEVGIDGFLPLERRAGCDVDAIRRAHPSLRMIGGFDKTCMAIGEEAMRTEFERLLPVMRQGGFVPGVDHQTPPDVSLKQYRVYARLLDEYCHRACEA